MSWRMLSVFHFIYIFTSCQSNGLERRPSPPDVCPFIEALLLALSFALAVHVPLCMCACVRCLIEHAVICYRGGRYQVGFQAFPTLNIS